MSIKGTLSRRKSTYRRPGIWRRRVLHADSIMFVSVFTFPAHTLIHRIDLPPENDTSYDIKRGVGLEPYQVNEGESSLKYLR